MSAGLSSRISMLCDQNGTTVSVSGDDVDNISADVMTGGSELLDLG